MRNRIYEDVPDEEIEYTESDLWTFEHVKCCACSQPLKGSKYLNCVTLDKRARWGYPIWGNILVEGAEGRACAYVCDSCIEQARITDLPINAKFAVEIGDGMSFVKYHLISGLADVPPIQSCPRCSALRYHERNRCEQCNHTWDDQKDHR